MSVNTETSRSLFTGNGATLNFVTGFYFRLTSEVVVTLTPSGGTPVVQTEGVHYNVTPCTGVGQADGEVDMVTAPPAASELKIERTVPFTQATSLRQAGAFDPAAHEDQYDEVVFQTQQLHRRLSALESAGAVGSVVAGNGVAFTGTTLNVGAGAGIQANADTVEVLYGAAGAMTQVSSAAANAGVANTAARIDHKHDVKTDVPVAVVAGAANAAGSGVSVALANHEHAAAVGAPVAVDAAAAVTGASGNFSDANHKHQVTVAAPAEITDTTEVEGVATSLARSDHQHGHGDRGGGTLHANAVSGGAAGFMSGADKAILDGLATARPRVRANQVVAQAIPNAADTQIVFEVEEYDTALAYNPITGLFTVPAGQGGYYSIEAMLHFAATVFAGASSVASFVRVNGSPVVQGGFSEEPAAGTFRPGLTLATTLLLVAGDTLAISVYSTGGVARNTYGDNTYAGGVQGSCSLAINKLD
ncbi:MAG: hypothetical protein Q8L48_16720 [Archangium sp.]|nr:hypothetical protein [Archangium sp.]